jgi:hypothetical protein
MKFNLQQSNDLGAFLSPHANRFSENSIKTFPTCISIIDLAKWAPRIKKV